MTRLSLAAVLGLLPASASAQVDPVVWTSTAGVAVSGNSLTKTAATGWGNAGAISTAMMDFGPAYVEFTVSETNKRRLVGLSYGDTNQDYTDIDFAIYLHLGNAYVYENGASRLDLGAYATSEVFRVEADGGVVRYRRNGVVVYTSGVVPQFPLLVDTALFDSGATLNNVNIGTAVFSRAVNVTVQAGSLIKTGNEGWNAGAISADALERGDGYVSFVASETDRDRACGLGFVDTDVSLADIEYAIVLGSDGTFSVVESGTPRGNFGSYLGGDVFRVEVQAGTVSYKHNGTTVLVSTVAPEYPMRVDTSLEDTGATLADIRLVKLLWTNAVGVSVSGATLMKTGAAGWDAGASSTTAIESGDGWMEFTATETTTDRVAGFGGIDVNQDPSDLEFGIFLKANGTFTAIQTGTEQGSPGSYVKGDRFRVEVVGGTVKYRKNGTVFYSSGILPTYPLFVDTSLNQVGATIKNVAVGTLVWQNESGVAVRGSSLQKTTTYGWNAGASTVASLPSGNGSIEIIAGEAQTGRSFGLSNGDQGITNTDIDFAFYLQAGSILNVQEKGVPKGSSGTFAPGDRLTVDVTNNVVRYYKNGTLFYTSTAAPVFPLLVDTSLLTEKATLTGLSFLPRSASVVEMPTFSPYPGSFNAEIYLTLSCLTPAAEIRYTTDGSTPTTASTLYTAPIWVSATTTVKAKAWKAGMTASPVATGAYAIYVVDPTVVPGSGTYDIPKDVGLSTSTSSATIRYTTDGTTPTTASPVLPPSGFVTVSQSLTLKARAWRTGWNASNVVSATYTLKAANPRFSPGGALFTNSGQVVLTSASPGVTIHYTTNGTTPTTASPSVPAGGSVTVTQTTATIKAIAVRVGWTTSDVAVAGPYTVTIDTDNDGLKDTQETQLGTNPNNPDTNGDGVPDGAAVAAGISPTSTDMDNDGVTNVLERSKGTDPFRVDSDGDGVNDSTDCFPLDPTRWQCPAPIPGDVTPPAITLTEPAGAILISSQP